MTSKPLAPQPPATLDCTSEEDDELFLNALDDVHVGDKEDEDERFFGPDEDDDGDPDPYPDDGDWLD